MINIYNTYYFSLSGVISAVEEDEGQTLTFTLLDNKEKFKIEEGNQLIQLVSLDYEAQNKYLITVQVTDDGDPEKSVSSFRLMKVYDSQK